MHFKLYIIKTSWIDKIKEYGKWPIPSKYMPEELLWSGSYLLTKYNMDWIWHFEFSTCNDFPFNFLLLKQNYICIVNSSNNKFKKKIKKTFFFLSFKLGNFLKLKIKSDFKLTQSYMRELQITTKS